MTADNLTKMLRRIIPLLVLALVVVACSSGSDTGSSTSTTGGGTGSTSTSQPTSTDPVAPTTTSDGAFSPFTPDLSGVEGLTDVTRRQLADLIIATQEVRGLAFTATPLVTVVSGDELEARVRAEIEEDAEEFPADEALYKLLGLLDPETDLEALLVNLYGDSVAGFYDGETGEIVVPALEEGFSIVQQGTLVHELTHALTDQHFSFDVTFTAMIDEERLDEAKAFQALIEGDATLAEVEWVRTLSMRELGEFVAESLEVDSTSFDASPQFIRDSLLFPYDSGLAFVQSLFTAGGWDAVNDAYNVFPDLPGSSEQVITPADYQRDLPVVVDIPSIDLAGYELTRTSVWGEESFRTMIDQVMDATTAAEAADGWGGDSYHQWFDGENAALLIVYKGDTDADVDELRETLLDFARSTVPEEDFVWVDEENGLLYFIAADETAVGERIRDTIGLT